MTFASPQALAVSALPLLAGHEADTPVAYRHGRIATANEFLNDVARVARSLPPGRHVLNTCSDRYRFAVGFAAAACTGRTCLLPSTLTADTVAQLRSFAPDTIELTDGEAGRLALPSIAYVDRPATDANRPLRSVAPVPLIPEDAIVAIVFTSGSTGLPVPHRKSWGVLVKCVRAEARLLGLADGRRHALLATVPPQHMYGFETSVLQPLQNGLALSSARPLYPADIAAALDGRW
jgi:acyl-coenzyme A synthetase/AMP-(fatty) acid ligase